MTNPDMTVEILQNLGFIDVGMWRITGDDIAYDLDGANAEANGTILHVQNALYAFVSNNKVLYIGKTARSIRKRYIGYCRPGTRQATNFRCHNNIKRAINDGAEVRIMIFAPITHLRYADFEINLAAGLEDSLIKAFNPCWNGGKKGQPISEDAEREEAEEAEREKSIPMERLSISPLAQESAPSAVAVFTIKLGPTCYKYGFLNPGVQVSRFLGKDNDPIAVQFSDGSQPVISKIDRTANRTGAVRIVGRNREIARWFQEHYEEGDTVEGRVLDARTIELVVND